MLSIILGEIVGERGRSYICDYPIKRKCFFFVALYKFFMSKPNLNLEMAIFMMVCNCYLTGRDNFLSHPIAKNRM